MSRRVERTFDHDPEEAAANQRAQRGLQRFAYTYKDIAQLVGKPVRAVKQDATARKVGKYSYPAKFDPKDLDSVLRYALRCGWPFKNGVDSRRR